MVLEIFTNPLTTFGDAGTLAAFGFLTAYFLISVAAPVYLKKQGELRARHVVVAAMACLLLMVPLIGSFYPVPPFPVDIFPYIFLAYMLAGSGWLFVVSRRNRGIFAEIEMDLEASMLSPQKHTEEVDRALERGGGDRRARASARPRARAVSGKPRTGSGGVAPRVLAPGPPVTPLRRAALGRPGWEPPTGPRHQPPRSLEALGLPLPCGVEVVCNE